LARDPLGWWARKVRQFGTHLVARVRPEERAGLAAWLRPAELVLFDRMHRADQRHGLDVVARLKAAGVTDRDVLAAGLLHDCGKGQVGVWPRIAYALATEYGAGARFVARRLPAMRRDLAILDRHADRSADLAAAAGLPGRVVDLIRWQDAPRDPVFGPLLKAADEAS
jgi:hypothetical protein